MSVLALLLAAQVATSSPAAVAESEDSNALAIALTSAGLSALVLGVGTQAWWENGLSEFRFRETGALERDTYAGGSDKFGHMYSTYVSTFIVTALYEALGLSHTQAVWYSALFAGLLWNGFELIDGFTEFGFEYGDVVFNTIGISTGVVSQLFPTFQSIFGFRIGYVPSRDFLAHDKSFLKFINDYTGMLFYADFRAKGIFEALGKDPGWARYLVGGLVWGTDHYSPIRRHELRRRTLGLHLGVSFSEVLRTFGDGDEGVEGVARFFDFYAVPFLGVQVLTDLNTGDWYLGFGVSNRSEVAL